LTYDLNQILGLFCFMRFTNFRFCSCFYVSSCIRRVSKFRNIWLL